MRNAILLLTLVLCVCTSLYAQKITVPQAAKDAFSDKFPKAEGVKWDRENTSGYEANFKLDGIDMSAVFLKDGTWKETETSIDIDQLPQPVLDAIKLNYSSGKLFGASKIVRVDDTTIYEADIKMKSKKKEVLFDEKGNILK
jgi:hypothetical protein